jgi:hypothetical protein
MSKTADDDRFTGISVLECQHNLQPDMVSVEVKSHACGERCRLPLTLIRHQWNGPIGREREDATDEYSINLHSGIREASDFNRRCQELFELPRRDV